MFFRDVSTVCVCFPRKAVGVNSVDLSRQRVDKIALVSFCVSVENLCVCFVIRFLARR